MGASPWAQPRDEWSEVTNWPEAFFDLPPDVTLLAQVRRRQPEAEPVPRSEGEGARFFHDLDLRFRGGWDDNPLRLGNNVRSGFFGQLRANYDLSYRPSTRLEIFAEGRYRLSKFDASVSEADRHDAKFTLGVKDRSTRLFSRRLRNTAGATFGLRRMTFVDNATGQTAVSGGQSLADRFDANFLELFVENRLRATQSSTVYLKIDGHYEEFTDNFVGQERLDYLELGVETTLRQQVTDTLVVRATPYYTRRFYSSRPAEDLIGDNIPGSDLRYNYFGFKTRVSQRFSKKFRVVVAAGIERRVDTETGFNNRTTIDAGGRIAYTMSDGQRVSLDGKWSRREFDHLDSANISTTNDGGRERQGYRIWLTYRSAPVFTGTSLFLRYRRESYDNSDLDYAYDRNVISGGFRVRL